MFGDDYDERDDHFEEAEELNSEWEESSMEFRFKNGDCGPQGFSPLAIALALMDPPF